MVAMETRKPGRPAGQTKLETEEIRARCVALAKQGFTQSAIAGETNLSQQAVSQHLAIYRAGLTPSSELAEEWRETKLQRAAERFARLRQRSLGVPGVLAEDGVTWIIEPADPDYAALAALQKEEDAISKLLGANVEQGGIRVQITREALAELFYGDGTVVEGEAVEEPPAAELEELTSGEEAGDA